MGDYKIIEGNPEQFREQLLKLYVERQECHDIAMSAVASGNVGSPSYLEAERRVVELSAKIADLCGRDIQTWMA